MRSGDHSLLRWIAPLLSLLVGVQLLLPQVHVAVEHLHPAPPVADHRSAEAPLDAESGGEHRDEGDCPVCHFLQVAGLQVLPGPPPAAEPVPAPVVAHRLLVPPVRANAPPDIVWSSPRGPPMA